MAEEHIWADLFEPNIALQIIREALKNEVLKNGIEFFFANGNSLVIMGGSMILIGYDHLQRKSLE
jgi:hypothetical protein